MWQLNSENPFSRTQNQELIFSAAHILCSTIIHHTVWPEADEEGGNRSATKWGHLSTSIPWQQPCHFVFFFVFVFVYFFVFFFVFMFVYVAALYSNPVICSSANQAQSRTRTGNTDRSKISQILAEQWGKSKWHLFESMGSFFWNIPDIVKTTPITQNRSLPTRSIILCYIPFQSLEFLSPSL